MFVCLCWGLTSQSTIFQSCRDGATASWVINQYFRGVKCLAQGHNTAAVGFEPPTSRSGPTLYHWATALPASTCILTFSMHKSDVTLSNVKETRTMGRMTSLNAGKERHAIPPSELLQILTHLVYIANGKKSCSILQQFTGRKCVTLFGAVLWRHPFHWPCLLDVRRCSVVFMRYKRKKYM